MKKPFLISVYEVNQALGNKLFKKVYDISRVSEIEDETESAKARKAVNMDLLTLKEILRDSYSLCRFRQKELKLNQIYA